MTIKDSMYFIMKDDEDIHVLISEELFKNRDFENEISDIVLDDGSIVISPENIKVEIDYVHMAIIKKALQEKSLFLTILSIIGDPMITFEIGDSAA